jgi:MFS family permease
MRVQPERVGGILQRKIRPRPLDFVFPRYHPNCARMSSPAQPVTRWQFFLRAFHHRNYRLFFGGQSLSLIGTWMTRIATSWLVYRLTGSAWMLGMIGFLGQVPTFVLGPFAGVWVDRWSRHRTLVWTQVLAMLQSLALAALTLTHTINMPWILFLTFLQGVINTFETPARQSFFVQMIESRSDLSNAIALNSIQFNLARVIGPFTSGPIYAQLGSAAPFLIGACVTLPAAWLVRRAAAAKVNS